MSNTPHMAHFHDDRHTVPTLSSCLVMHGTDIYYEIQAVVCALWPNVWVLAPRRWLLASSHYPAICCFIHYVYL